MSESTHLPASAAWGDFLGILAQGQANYYIVTLRSTETEPVPLGMKDDGSDVQILACEKLRRVECVGAPRVLKSGIVLLPTRTMSSSGTHMATTRCIHISEVGAIDISADELNRILPSIKVNS